MTEPASPQVVEVETLLQSARAAVRDGRHVDARLLFLEALAHDASGTARTEWGCYLWQTGDLREAEAQFRALHLLAHLAGNTLLESVALHNLAAVLREGGNASAAATRQQAAWNLAHAASRDWPHSPETEFDSEPNAALGADLAGRANDAIAAGDLELAEQLLMASLHWETLHGSVAGRAADWGSLGAVAALQGRLPLAVQRFCHALKLHRRAADWQGAACDLLNLAEVCCDLDRWSTAERLARHAARLFDRAGQRTGQRRAERLHRRLRRRRLLPTFDPRCN